MKKRLSEQQEFELMKLVLDKFLWIGFIVMAFGTYQMAVSNIAVGSIWFIAGVALLLLFVILLIKEYEILR
tara:strand:- start:24203 stop:24415 length:213 start_codon:yes stop_codon:yes gene_type:complete